MIWYSITLSTKTNDSTAVSANPTKDHSKTPRSRRNEQSIPPIMKNERPITQQNLLKRERYRPEHSQLHQIPNWGVATCTGFQLPKWATNPRQPKCPAAADPPGRGVRVQRIEERDSRRVHLLCPLVRRKATIKSPRTTWYSPLVKPERTPKAQRRFLIKKHRKSADCKS